MGVDTKIRLPVNVRVRDVADTIGILLGLKPEKRVISRDGAWAVIVPGVSVFSIPTFPDMCEINIVGANIGEPNRFFHYHFEPSFDGRLMIPSSCAINIAMGVKLVNFFGGSVDYQDCDSTDFDYKVPKKGRKINSPEDGPEWYRFQQKKFALQPLTQDFIDRYEKFAAYKKERETNG